MRRSLKYLPLYDIYDTQIQTGGRADRDLPLVHFQCTLTFLPFLSPSLSFSSSLPPFLSLSMLFLDLRIRTKWACRL